MDRESEVAKYRACYQDPNYRMGRPRMLDAQGDVAGLPRRGSYLDVGCGRGEMLAFAEREGFSPVRGVEALDELADGERIVVGRGHALPFPDKAFDVVTLFDVIEHLVPGDDEATCKELARVARHHIVLTANNRPSTHYGVELHINRRPYQEWDGLFRQWFPGTVSWLRKNSPSISETWRIDL